MAGGTLRAAGFRICTIALLAASVLTSATATATAAETQLPVGKARGVVVKWDKRGQMVVVFSKRASHLYRRLAGKKVSVACWHRTADGYDGGPVTFTAPKRGRVLRTGDLVRDWDYCRVWIAARRVKRRNGESYYGPRLIVSIPLTQKGAVYLDEHAKALALNMILLFAAGDPDEQSIRYLSPSELIGRPDATFQMPWIAPTRYRLVVLAGPGDTPPSGAIGYYSDGQEHAAAVVVSASGRRLFVERKSDDVLNTNVAGYIYGGGFE